MANQAFIVENGEITKSTEIYDGGLYFADAVTEMTRTLRECQTLVVKTGSTNDLHKIKKAANLF